MTTVTVLAVSKGSQRYEIWTSIRFSIIDAALFIHIHPNYSLLVDALDPYLDGCEC